MAQLKNGNGRRLAPLAIASLLGTTLGGGGATVFASVSRADVRELLETSAPYVEDRKAIQVRLDHIDADLADIRTLILELQR